MQCKICTLPSAQQMEPDASKPLFTVHLKGNQFVLFQFAFVFHSLFITFICHFCHFIELPRAAVRILSNMTFLFVSLSYTAESAIVTAFITFIPKFIESQFGIPASNASIYTGKALPMSVTLQGLLFFGWWNKSIQEWTENMAFRTGDLIHLCVLVWVFRLFDDVCYIFF